MRKPLENVKILDLTQFLSGSYCTMLLAAMGAQVIKAERPKGGDPVRASSPFAGPQGVSVKRQTPDDMSLGSLKRLRNKKSIGLDLGTEKGRELFLELVKNVDIVIENYKYGTLDKMGLTYEKMKEVNPAIIYASLSGFGEVEAYKRNPAFDIIVQGMSGLMNVNGTPDMEPMKVGMAIGDQPAGMFTAIGILSAYIHVKETGIGARITVSMLESIMAMLMDEAHDFHESKGNSVRNGNSLPRLTPFNCYKCKDGHFVVASGGSDKMWDDMLIAMGREDLRGDERYAQLPGRVQRTKEVDAIIEEWSQTVTVEEAVSAIAASNIPVGPVRTVTQAWNDPHLIEAKAIVPVEHRSCGIIEGIHAAQNPIRYHADDCDNVFFDKPAPAIGEHNEEIYSSLLGLDSAEIAALKEAGVI